MHYIVNTVAQNFKVVKITVSKYKLVALLFVVATLGCVTSGDSARNFPEGLVHAEWTEFSARGYSKPVTGVIYRGRPRPTCGMPLGGLDTGCIDIEANGMLGYSTIFNHLYNPRLLYNTPFLALSVDGKTCLLATDTKAKADRPLHRQTGVFPPLDYSPAFFDVGPEGVERATSIDYWGHYPMLDMEFDTPRPVEVGLRAYAPFLPGDEKTSMAPGVVFEFTLRNPTQSSHSGTLAFSFPGFDAPDSGKTRRHSRKGLVGDLNGVEVNTLARGNAQEMTYILASFDGGATRHGADLGSDGAAWNAVEESLPAVSGDQTGSTLALDFRLAPGETTTRRVVLSWFAPNWNASGSPDGEGNDFAHMYAAHYPNALTVARMLAAENDSLKKRVIAWQEEIYGDKQLPGWLADALVNNLHLIPETSVWGQANGSLSSFAKADGLFGLNECPRGCPQIECIPCSFYGNMPIVYFYPKAALSTLRGYKAYQFENGRPPWIFGGVTASDEKNKGPFDLAAPDIGYQTVLNGACYVIMADRYWQTTGDKKFLEEFYDSLKRANDFSMNLRPKYGLSQVMSMPEPGTDAHGMGDTEWFEAPEPGWKGYVTHAGAVRMAQVQVMKRMAQAMGDDKYAAKCDLWLAAGSKVLEEILWNGSYYLNFHDKENGVKSDLIFGYQLDGEWIVDAHGVPGVFPKPKVDQTLATIRNANCKISQTGATNYANPDGTPAKVGGYGTFGYFPPELMMLAMTYMYEGEKEFGLELLRKCMENIHCQWGYTWDAPNTVRGDKDTGQRHFGADYYQNMMLWFAPAAVAGQDMTGPVKDGGLVNRVMRAAKGL